MRRTPLLMLLLAASIAAQNVPSPREHFGFEPGEDRRLIPWDELLAYYRLVAERSPHVRLEPIGRTTEDRDLVMLVVSDRPDAELARIRERQEHLARGTLPLSELQAVAAEQPAVVFIQGTLHSTEIAASTLFPHVLYRLATGTDDGTLTIRHEVVTLIVPSANPDGQDQVVRWYEETLDTPWEGTGPVELYHRYAGHDDNRDWFMLSLAETRSISEVLYQRWFPEIVLDIHQMGSSGARMFVPPYADPVNPNIPPLLLRELDLVGTSMALALTQNGCPGVVQDVTFDNWWAGGARSMPYRHNMVGILTETASARLASPIWLSESDLRGHGRGLPEYRQQGNLPDPWPGGWWRMGDIVRYQSVGTFALLDLAARYREMFLLNFHRLGREAIARGRAEPPYAFLLPADQADRGAVLRLVSNLLATGAEVFRAQGAFENDGVTHAAGTFVIPCAQAFSPHVRDLLEPQLYPALKLTRDGDVIRPYDASGWTLPYQFGVSCQAAGTPLPQDLELVPVTLPLPRDSRLTGAREAGLAAAPTANGAFTLANRALAAGLAVQRVREQGPQLGTFIFPAGAQSRLAELGADLALDIGAAADLGPDATVALRKPRVGLLAPWPGSMDAGWTRLVLEEAGFDPLLLTYPEVRSGRLGERIDALVIPDVSARRLKDGAGRELPPAWQGGLGVAGAAAIRQFVEDGGTLLAFGGATAYAIEQFGIPVENPLAALRDKERVVVPGSLLRLVAASGTDGSGVLAGAPREIAAFVDTALVFRGKRAKDAPPDVPEVRSLLVYPPGDPLLSGYLENGQRLTGLPALAEAFVGRGRVLLYGFRPQHRSQTLGTFRLIFNPLFDSAR